MGSFNVNSHELIFFQLRKRVSVLHDHPLKQEMEGVSHSIRSLLESGTSIQQQPMPMLSQLFELRMKVLRWAAVQPDLDLHEMLLNATEAVEKFFEDERLAILTENLLFALRCNQRVTKVLLEHAQQHANEPSDALDFSQFPELSYEQFLGALAISLPSEEAYQKIMQWSKASLHIEFGLLATDIIFEEQLDVPQMAVEELAELVAESAQEYAALATEMGLYKRPAVARRQSEGVMPDKSFMQEQHELAETGLQEFLKNAFN